MTKIKASDFEKGLEKTYLENVKHEEEEWNKTHNIGGNDQEAIPSWEERFYEKYNWFFKGRICYPDPFGNLVHLNVDLFEKELSGFIRQTIKTEREQAVKEQQDLIEFLQKERNELAEKLKIANKQAVKEYKEIILKVLPKKYKYLPLKKERVILHNFDSGKISGYNDCLKEVKDLLKKYE